MWFGDGRFLLWSDIPANRILRWDETNGVVGGTATPPIRQWPTPVILGRLLSCDT